jgi:HEAT repeats
MKTLVTPSLVGLVWWLLAVPSQGQTIERDTTITGPRGNSIERQVEIQRKPGSIDRQVQIKRPGGTFDRQVQVQRSPSGAPRRGPLIAGPWPRPPWIPRTVVIGQPAPALGFGLMAAPMLNFSFGGGGGGMGFGGGPGGPGGMGPGGSPGGPAPPPDQVALMTQRLQSFYWNSRKDAAYTLGRLGDPRAVPSLVHVLKYDLHKDVRIASAIALGEIGGSDAAIALERSSIYDHKEDVRHAATTAIERLNAKAKAAPPNSSELGRPRVLPQSPDPSTRSPFQGYPGAPESSAESPSGKPEPAQPEPAANQPPPPPTPVTGNAGSGNGDSRE